MLKPKRIAIDTCVRRTLATLGIVEDERHLDGPADST